MGDLTTDHMYFLADLAERYSNGNIRTTINQNMIIRWIPEFRLAEFYPELASNGLGDPGAELVEDIIACPGTDTCGLGITSSKGMARALAGGLSLPARSPTISTATQCQDQRLSQLPARSTILPRSACTAWGNALVNMSRLLRITFGRPGQRDRKDRPDGGQVAGQERFGGDRTLIDVYRRDRLRAKGCRPLLIVSGR